MVRLRRPDWIVIGAALSFSATLSLAALELQTPAAAEQSADTTLRGLEPRLWTSRNAAATGPLISSSPHGQQRDSIEVEIERQISEGNGCLTCHRPDTLSMHELEKQVTCVECHGGNAKEPWNPKNHKERVPADLGPDSREVRARMERAHVLPKRRDLWVSSDNPQRAGVASLDESAEFIQFVNPSRSSCRGEDVWPLPLRRERVRQEKHDDAWWDALERRSLQQRILPIQRCPVRRVLPVRWNAGTCRSLPGSDAGTDASLRGATVLGPAVPLGAVTARERAAHFRARRTQAAGTG